MTIVDIRNQIISYYFSNDTFSMKFDISKITVGSNQEECKDSLIFQVMQGLEELGVIKTVQSSEDTIFVITDHFSNTPQDLKISGITANEVADCINQYREALGVTDNGCDKLNITDRDILNICVICHDLLESTFDELTDEGESEI